MPGADLNPDLSSYGGYGQSNRLLAAATNTPQNASDWLTVARQGQALKSDQFDLAQKHLSALNQLAASVMADPTPDNATARISQGVQMGVIQPDDAANEINNLTQLGGDPAKIKQWAYQHASTIMNVQQQLSSSYGDAGLTNNGQQLVPTRTVGSGPSAGVYAAGGNSLQQYMTPGQAAAPADLPLTNGTTLHTTTRGYNQAVGDPAGLPPSQGAAAPSAPGYSGLNNPNSYVDPRRAATATVTIGPDGHPVYTPNAPATPPAPAGTQAGDVVKPGPISGGRYAGSSGTGPITAGASVNGGQAGAPQPTVPGAVGPSPMLGEGLKTYQDDLNNSSAKMQGVQPLLNALPLIEKLGQTGSGPGTKPWNDAKSALVSAGVIPADATDVDVREEANKYLNQYVARSNIAQRSDMGTLVSQQSSPNLDTSNKATLALTRNAIAQDRMEAARPLAYGRDDLSGYAQHKAAWTQSQDPRAYQLDVMPADQRTALLQQMAAKRNTAEGQKFFASLRNAMTARVVTPPSASPALVVGTANAQQ